LWWIIPSIPQIFTKIIGEGDLLNLVGAKEEIVLKRQTTFKAPWSIQKAIGNDLTFCVVNS
jgi:hypothetical protein